MKKIDGNRLIKAAGCNHSAEPVKAKEYTQYPQFET
jgi:hypothetical protein